MGGLQLAVFQRPAGSDPRKGDNGSPSVQSPWIRVAAGNLLKSVAHDLQRDFI
jgi:hypothetical protein